ncbi:MauE/DoxX family redox-associated membrane protein [Sphingobacterium multivorum]|uniref:MauE/DoxX family redox-associated membrane protein n=1 Tax=Sphingobacterium multivorum TaxID=28454 RepID=UPI0028AC55B4|nr:MauE/DoxX family redox-associated membrane protein [Sphingobacterium multivorum]
MKENGKYRQYDGAAAANTVQGLRSGSWLGRKFTGVVSYIRKHPQEFVLQVLTFALLCLWIYVGSKKVFTYAEFRASMIRQPFADQYGIMLSYILPAVELATGILFIFEGTKRVGFWSTLLLMFVFSGYVILALRDTWGSIPCDCILEFPISWKTHLWVNGLIIIACVVGLLLDRKIRISPQRKLMTKLGS